MHMLDVLECAELLRSVTRLHLVHLWRFPDQLYSIVLPGSGYSALTHLRLHAVRLDMDYGERWQDLPNGIRLIDLMDCSGIFLDTFGLATLLEEGRFPHLGRLAISHINLKRPEMAAYEKAYFKTDIDAENKCRLIAHRTQGEEITDADYVWPCQRVVADIVTADELAYYDWNDDQVDLCSLLDILNETLDFVRAQLAARGVDCGTDRSFLYYSGHWAQVRLCTQNENLLADTVAS